MIDVVMGERRDALELVLFLRGTSTRYAGPGAKSGRYWPVGGRTGGKGGMAKWRTRT